MHGVRSWIALSLFVVLMVGLGACNTVSSPPTITKFSASPNPVTVNASTTFSWAVGGVSASATCTLDAGDSSAPATISACGSTLSANHTYHAAGTYKAMLSVVGTSVSKVVTVTVSPPPTGTLNVSVTGLPLGSQATVMVTGPGAYSKTLSVTGTGSTVVNTLNVAPGTYAVTAATGSDNGTTVPVEYDATPSSQSSIVTSNAATTASVAYSSRAGSGHLWVPVGTTVTTSTQDLLDGYSNGTLTSPPVSPSPDVSISGSDQNAAEGVAIDGAGNVFLATASGYIYEYTGADLDLGGTPPPTTKIDATTYGEVFGLAFDSQGDLWAAAWGSNQLLMYTPAQLTGGGGPQVVISQDATTNPDLNEPTGLAFDASGNLWVANQNSNTVLEYKASDLAGSGSPAPAVKLTASSGSLSEPYGIAFDANGNLWVANYLANTVVRFDKNKLGTGGGLTPDATIQGLSGPEGLAFDRSGSLWVADWGSQDLRQFTNVSSLSGSTSPSAAATVGGLTLGDAYLMAFSPPPSTVPINTP